MTENSNKSAKRRPGRPFQKGQSGNPGGRPKISEDVKEAARAHTQKAIETLVNVLDFGDSSAAKVRAAEALLNRGWGTPTQSISVDPESAPVRFVFEWSKPESNGA